MEKSAKILICDESREERRKLVEALKNEGYHTVDEAESGEDATRMLGKLNYDLVIVDLWISGIDGIGLIRSARKYAKGDLPSFILTSSINKQSLLIEASEAGADMCLLKPYDISSMLSHIKTLVKIQLKLQINVSLNLNLVLQNFQIMMYQVNLQLMKNILEN